MAFQVVPALVLVVGMAFLPESPRYLVEKEKYSEAMRVLRKLHFDGRNEDWIEAEYNEICRTIEAEKAVAAPGWLAMFTVPQWRTRMLYAYPWPFMYILGLSLTSKDMASPCRPSPR